MAGIRIEPGALRVTGTIRERARTTPLGEWIAVSHDALDFSAGGFYSWTVEAGDVLTNRYTLIGKTMLWTLRVGSSSVLVDNGPFTNVRAKIPGGFNANASGSFAAGYFNDNGTVRSMLVESSAGSAWVVCSRLDGGNIATSTNGTFVYFSIFVELE
jgi:hypothetical protein